MLYADDAEHETDEGHLASRYARRLTSALEATRERLEETVTNLLSGSSRLGGHIRDLADDASYLLDPAPWLQSFYSSIGLASAGSLGEIDERLDELEMRIDSLARERARGELLLLQARIVELEQVLSSVRDHEARDAVFELVEKLGSLEHRIDSIPWPREIHQEPAR